MTENIRSLIRKQIYELIPKNSRVIDIGCGKGYLLRELSNKIKYGLGIDINQRKINFATKKKLDNLEFRVINTNKLDLKENFDVAIAMFMIHSLDYSSQIKTLKNMSKISKEIILVDFVWSDSFIKKALMYIDEFLVGHYNNFKIYKELGMEKLIEDSGLKSKKTNGINNMYKIWICEKDYLK